MYENKGRRNTEVNLFVFRRCLRLGAVHRAGSARAWGLNSASEKWTMAF
jgi:hypothetical protein